MAAAIADRLGAALLVVTVLESLPVYSGPDGLEALPPDIDQERWNEREASVRRHMVEAIGSHDWQFHGRSGAVTKEICDVAETSGAALIVVSAAPRRHNDRVVAGVRAAQLLRYASCPVLSVAPQSAGLPRRILAGVDFGPPSVYATETALSIAAEHADVTLLHVSDDEWTRARTAGDAGQSTGDASFTATLAMVAPYRRDGMTIRTMHDTGDVADALLRRATDLIAVGTHGPGVFERFFLGSVSTNILHVASVSVLAAPRPSVAEATRLTLGLRGTACIDTPDGWKEVLDAFSRRNVGRRVTLEVDEASVGAQLQARGYLLRGIVYDPRDRRVECMLGTRAGHGAHLTRMIEHVHAITVHAHEGCDRALEIHHDDGHTILMLGAREEMTEARSTSAGSVVAAA
jgi:nucleotide-binding universal stress UspA family protein